MSPAGTSRWVAALCAAAMLGACGKGAQPQGTPSTVSPHRLASAAASVPTTASGDAAAGERIATQGVPAAGVAPCVGCHGPHGDGNAGAGFPRLAGQSQTYLFRQLQAYADGTRANPLMLPIAKGLTDMQRRDVTAYFKTQIPQAITAQPPISQPSASPSARGKTLAISGDEALHVQACANCHGPEGAGEPPTYPALAGQGSVYLANALKAWKDHSRRTDPSQQMPAIAGALSDADIEAVAQYYALLAPPQPAASPSPASLPPSSAAASGPHGNTGGTQGIGVEQGSPTTGGGQGPGGGGSTNGPQPTQQPADTQSNPQY